ncbi:XRE family transcriptional regulator [Solwaraspora sp. WMMD406]|uniref:XRE family transcriptional regulator n=1 Tax=Solwaraspora sp. WMMD406 TaxID=3016095 RepID=UPI0024176650|nr:XRE family transcriptional regulator [Solwaraspora sp. WMMD406]MDG4768584.1 XRE family transcriptional regulator [Solwaraspora sp. WMMD406]
MGELERHVGHAWLTFQHGHYAQLVRTLPELLDAAQRRHAIEPEQGAELLVHVYRITASLLVKLDEADLAWLVADRAMTVAAGDQVRAASVVVQLGQALRALLRNQLALTTTIAAADRIASAGRLQLGSEERSVCGALLLQAAHAAAGCGDQHRVQELLDRATEAAERISDDPNRHQISFGPVAVALTEVVTAAELGDIGGAVRLHEKAIGHEQWQRLPAEYRAAYLVDVARAYLQVGDVGAAGRLLVKADRVAAAEVRYRPAVRTVLAAAYRSGAAPNGLTRLAAAVGVGR